MILAGLIFLAIALLILIVWALHRNQQQHNAESADRNVPLPPLELRESEDVSAEDILGIEPEDLLSSQATPATPATPATAARGASTSEFPGKPAVASPSPSTTPASVSAAENWLEESKALQQQERFDAALAVCVPALPQMGAFRQACQILRARIRAERKARKSSEESLGTLYHYAALADFFHARGAAGKPLSPAALKRVNFHDWQTLENPYQMLGYEQLALLTKTDIKALQELWGEPQAHTHMRALHPHAWQSLQSDQSLPHDS